MSDLPLDGLLAASKPAVPQRPVDKPIADMSVDELAVAVRYHNWRYFELADTEISDYAFDALTRRLKALAPEHPALAELVGTTSEDKIFHDAPMLSLDKAYDAAAVEKWATTFEGPIIEAPKIDGMAASLKYDAQGKLVHAATRGDGVRGELFTKNALYIDAIPKQVPGTGRPFEVRGEVFLPLSVFEARFAGTFASPRNTCAGAIKSKEPQRTADYSLAFFAYSVRGRDDANLSDGLAWATSVGFPVVPYVLRERGDIQNGYDQWLAKRTEVGEQAEGRGEPQRVVDFELDGVVYTADVCDEQRRLGETSHHPRWAIAFKFQGESGTSTIVDIEWSVSRTGAITPVAIIEPVTLSGASVTRCSLHNLQIIRNLGASIGAKVLAMRRGGVIPHIEAVLEPGPAPVEIPDRCPASGHATIIVGDFLMCSEPHHCPAARLGTLEHWLKAVDVEGFGPKIIQQVVERGWVNGPADVYRLTQDDLESLDRLGRKSAQNLITAVAARKRIPLQTFLAALGVDGLGWVVAKKVGDAFVSLARVMAATEADIAAIHGLGEITARSIRTGLDVRSDIISDLLKEVVVEDANPAAAPVAAADPDDPVAGKSFVFTGKMATMKREDAQAAVKARGGTAPGDVSKKLDYLVIGDDASALTGGGERSSKHKKADKLVADGAPLRIISEADFRTMLGL